MKKYLVGMTLLVSASLIGDDSYTQLERAFAPKAL